MTPQELVYRNRLTPEFRAVYEAKVSAMVTSGVEQRKAEGLAVWETIRLDGCNVMNVKRKDNRAKRG